LRAKFQGISSNDFADFLEIGDLGKWRRKLEELRERPSLDVFWPFKSAAKSKNPN
jgi:hypothetical protein